MSKGQNSVMAKRRDGARVVKRPQGFDLQRRPEKVQASEGLKAAVVASLMLGTPAAQIAQQFGLDPSTVKRWEQAYDITNPIKRRDNLSEMMMVFIEQELSSLMSISIATSDEEWIKSQDADALAVLVGAKQDRLMQILAAFSKAQQSRSQLAEGQEDEND